MHRHTVNRQTDGGSQTRERKALPDRHGEGSLNDNVLIEVGSMLMTGRRCAILKDPSAPAPPTDLSGQIYKSVDVDNLELDTKLTHRWIAEDLGLGTCPEC